MQTLEALRGKIGSIEDLQAVVRTMKALAMVNIRQYEKVRSSLCAYSDTVELGLQALLHQRHFSETAQGSLFCAPRSNAEGTVGVILLGSDHGLCGSFNEHLVDFALEELAQRGIPVTRCRVAAVGARLLPHLAKVNLIPQSQVFLPSSLAGVTRLVQTLLCTLQDWRLGPSPLLEDDPSDEQRTPLVEQILLFHHQSRSNTTHQPTALHLLPLDPVWLAELERKPWDSSSLPMLTMPWRAMVSKLVRLYLFVSLYRAVVESLASENASRLVSMQAAEKNIDDRLLELNADYRQQRQNSITGELLDIVAGFEALNTMR